MSQEEWGYLTEKEKFEAHTVDHHGYWDLLSMTNSALKNSLLVDPQPQPLEEVYGKGEERCPDAGFVIVYEFPDLKRGTFWHLFTHLYDYCNSEGLRVTVDSDVHLFWGAQFKHACPKDLRQWPRIELRIPEGMIEKESPYYLYPEMPDEWMPAGTTHGTRWGCGDERKRAVPFRRLQRAYRRAISEEFLNMESTPWQIKISWPELRFELLSPLRLVVSVGDESLLDFTPYSQHKNKPPDAPRATP